jgi:hypothetical protein
LAAGASSVATSPVPIVYREATCAACVADGCFEPEIACRRDVACSVAYACLAACSNDDPACRWACESTHPESTGEGSLAAAVDVCRRARCPEACFGVHGLARVLGDDCSTCADLRCGEEQGACVVDGDCERFVSCSSAGALSPDRTYDCEARYAADRDAFDGLRACLGSCAAECQWGKHDACLGGYSWSHASRGPLPFTARFRTFPALTAAAGVELKACDEHDCTGCEFPVDVATTDAQGMATLALPLDAGTFTGCLFLRGPGFPDSVMYLGRPVGRIERRFAINLPTTDVLGLLPSLTGVQIDPDRGTIVINAADCLLDGASGLSLSFVTGGAGAVPYYLQGSKVSTTATATDGSGVAGFFDVPEGDVTLRLTVAATGETFAEADVHVAKGKVIGVLMLPRPAP